MCIINVYFSWQQAYNIVKVGVSHSSSFCQMIFYQALELAISLKTKNEDSRVFTKECTLMVNATIELIWIRLYRVFLVEKHFQVKAFIFFKSKLHFINITKHFFYKKSYVLKCVVIVCHIFCTMHLHIYISLPNLRNKVGG